MRQLGRSLILVTLGIMTTYCASGSSKKSAVTVATVTSGQASGTMTDSAGTPSSATADATSTPAITVDNYPNGFYTGMIGKTGMSILLPSFRQYKLADSSIAKIEPVTVTIPQATLASFGTVMAQLHLPITITPAMLSGFATQTVFKLTPLKTGTTTITSTKPGATSSTTASSDAWSAGTQLTLTVGTYTEAQIAKGRGRYMTDHDSSNPACASCHLSGKDGAPPHALGDINLWPDVAALQWLTTGKIPKRAAKIPHAWKFADADEQLATVAYVRTLESNDAEQLILLEVAQKFGLKVGDDGSVTIDPSTTAGAALLAKNAAGTTANAAGTE